MKSVSRVFLDEIFKPIKVEYIVDGIGGITRLWSVTLAQPEIHGFGPIFLTAVESVEESMVHAIIRKSQLLKGWLFYVLT